MVFQLCHKHALLINNYGIMLLILLPGNFKLIANLAYKFHIFQRYSRVIRLVKFYAVRSYCR